MTDIPAEKIAALAVEKLKEALRETSDVNVRVALALVSLLAETRGSVAYKPLRNGAADPKDFGDPPDLPNFLRSHAEPALDGGSD